ncbi:MAG: SDR family oxidoreductase, partial [Candidatus Latescibacteria bacterium]|nr:SDR family oxidoreductase [Candidatus Latescibacterota bacterium]
PTKLWRRWNGDGSGVRPYPSGLSTWNPRRLDAECLFFWKRLTRTLALELAAYGVRVNAVCPGPVYTEFNQRNMAQRRVTLGLSEEDMIERIRSAIPLGRWGEPEDIAQGVAFLCSPAASWITGEVLRVSGGMEGVSATPPKRPPQ